MAMPILTLLQKALGILILFGFLLGALLVLVAPYELYRLQRARDWPSREGLIEQASVHQTSGRRPTWQPLLRGQFTDNGEKFVITRVRYGDFRWGEQHSRRLIADYPPGSRVQIYFDPERPQERILQSQATSTPAWTALALGVALLALPFALYGWGRLRERHKQSA